jgi:hypothetical protein
VLAWTVGRYLANGRERKVYDNLSIFEAIRTDSQLNGCEE